MGNPLLDPPPPNGELVGNARSEQFQRIRELEREVRGQRKIISELVAQNRAYAAATDVNLTRRAERAEQMLRDIQAVLGEEYCCEGLECR